MAHSVNHLMHQGTNFVNPVLQRYADKLPRLMLDSKSDSTVDKYYKLFLKWEEFIKPKGESSLPASSVHISLFIIELLEKNLSHSSVISYICAIKWVHDLHGYIDPTNHPFVKNMLETVKRKQTKNIQKKDHVTSDMLVELCRKYEYSSDLLTIRDLTMTVFMFIGFMRFDEMSSLRCNDVIIEIDHLKIKIAKAKNDQYRKGNEVLLAKLDSPACPYKMFSKYKLAAGIESSSSDYLFKQVNKAKLHSKLIGINRKLSYTNTRARLVALLKEVDHQGSNLGLHSLRAGGATAAANAGINDRCWKRHGRWRSDTAKDGYVADSVQVRLNVSKNLGL